MSSVWREILPRPVWELLRVSRRKLLAVALKDTLGHLDGKDIISVFNSYGLNVSQVADYYSPLPVVSALKRNEQRWARPSEMIGVRYDLDAMRQLLIELRTRYGGEYCQLPPYDEVKKIGYGPGYTTIDAMVLYFMLRKIKPRRYIEIGSGLSTWYSFVAGEQNAREGSPLQIKCIDPFPSKKLCTAPGIEVVAKEVQDVGLEVFGDLHAGDVLFIDSTHVVRIDGDVPYLYLEVLPRLRKGVVIHIHDIHFPFNTPYPPGCYVLGGWKWPVFWTEAMLLQALLSSTDAFQIRMSAPLLRFHSEDFLQRALPNYKQVDPEDMDTHFGSIWIEKAKECMRG
jgi:hypothetical protein